MEYLYVLVHCDGHEWEDTVIFTTEQEAIETSMKNSNIRVEIFKKNANLFKKNPSAGYSPTYNYYQNGEIYINISH